MEKLEKHFSFLDGEGEMATLTRNHDWSVSPIGTPANWQHSLKTTLGLLLHSAFPMFLFWGDELTCFYNDAYRPSLGTNGKHPCIGKPGKEVWPEIWNFIGPIIDKVRSTGEAAWFENQFLPIYRNGRLEDVYWTFSYSPIFDDNNQINGVFVTCTETTEIVKNLQKLAESEDRFRTMAEGTDVLIAVGDETSNAVYFNKAWVELTGRPMEDLLKFGWVDLVHPEDREAYLKIYLDAFEKKVSFTGEFRVKNKEGNYRWLLAKGPARFRADGSFAGYISSCIDITERKIAEKAFSQSELRMRTLVESAPFPIGVYIGREMKVALANQAIIKVWGKGDDVIGKLFGHVLPELDNQEVLKQLDEVYTSGIPFHVRHQHLDLEVDGKLQPYYFNYSLTPLFDEAGNVYGVMNTGADVTDLNLAKQKVDQSEKNLRTMILQSPVAMCILLGPEHIIDVANDSMIALWGKSEAAVMQKPVFEALPDAREQGLENLLANVFNTGETFKAAERPVNLIRKGKLETVYQNFAYEPYRDGEGRIIGILAISIDVTDQVLARQKIEDIVTERTKKLAEVNQSLAVSNAELEQFAYITSHDLQEPVRKISTYSQMLEQSLGIIDTRPQNYLNKINNAAARMLTLIRDVLNYSQFSKEISNFTDVNLQDTVKDALIDFELLIEQKHAIIEYRNLPTLEAIPLQMAQLFGNLISNSLKFSKADTDPLITITAAILPGEERIANKMLVPGIVYHKIQFTDNGIGFKQEYAEQIFNIFQRLHGRSDYAGTGIGLATCKKIIENHKGEIYAKSSPGNGTVFIIILPQVQNSPGNYE